MPSQSYACPGVNDIGFVAWLREYEGKESARGDLAQLAADDEYEWEDGRGFVFYWLRIPRAAELALKDAWRAYVRESRHQGPRASPHAPSPFCFTTEDLRGKPRRAVAGHILRKLEEEVVEPCECKPVPWPPDKLDAKVVRALHAPVRSSPSEHTYEVMVAGALAGYTRTQIVALLERDEITRRRWSTPGREQLRQRELRKLDSILLRFGPDGCVQCRREQNRAFFDLVSCCVQFGYPDKHVVYLVGKLPAAQALWPDKPITRYRQTKYLIRKLRKQHQHVGRKCSTANCSNAPDWMRGTR